MPFPSRRNIGLAAPFLALLGVSLGLFFHYTSGRFLLPLNDKRVVQFRRDANLGFKPVHISSACPSIAYEFETVQLVVTTGTNRPLILNIEAPDEIEVQGRKEREVEATETWFLLPKEQGEYTVVLRSLEIGAEYRNEHHISVRRFWFVTRRWFYLLVGIGALIGTLGAAAKLWPSGSD
jgi:hypothetical protein